MWSPFTYLKPPSNMRRWLPIVDGVVDVLNLFWLETLLNVSSRCKWLQNNLHKCDGGFDEIWGCFHIFEGGPRNCKMVRHLWSQVTVDGCFKYLKVVSISWWLHVWKVVSGLNVASHFWGWLQMFKSGWTYFTWPSSMWAWLQSFEGRFKYVNVVLWKNETSATYLTRPSNTWDHLQTMEGGFKYLKAVSSRWRWLTNLKVAFEYLKVLSNNRRLFQIVDAHMCRWIQLCDGWLTPLLRVQYVEGGFTYVRVVSTSWRFQIVEGGLKVVKVVSNNRRGSYVNSWRLLQISTGGIKYVQVISHNWFVFF